MVVKATNFNIKDLLLGLILVLVYFVAAKLGLKLAFVNASATAVWPPTGIAIASILIFGYKVVPAIFLGAFLANVTTAGTILSSLGIASGNTLEGLAGAYLVNKFANGRYAFDKTENILAFTYLAGVIAPLISATIGVVSLHFSSLAPDANILPIWFTWWLGDASGALIIAPLILLWSNQYKVNWRLEKLSEAFIIFFTLFFISWIIFGSSEHFPIDFLLFPILLWVAFRFGVREIVTATALLSSVAIWGTLSGRGPFVRPSQNESLLLLQAFMTVVIITKAIVASVVTKSRESDKLKDEFVSMVSHELRTPMAAIKGYIALIDAQTYGQIPEKLKKPLNNISNSTERLIVLVNDLLDTSRLEFGELKPNVSEFSIKQVVEEVIENLMPIARQKKVDLLLVKNSLPDYKVRADPNYTRQILQNIIGNSLKFTSKGKISVSLIKSVNWLNISVTDTGVGIAKENQAKIFSKFQQISSKQKGRPEGTGLGLYISLKMAQSQGSQLRLERSEVGKGTTFVLSLPMLS